MEKVCNAAAGAGGGMKGRAFAWAAKQARALSKATAYVDSPLAESAVAGPVRTRPSRMPQRCPPPVLLLPSKLRGRIADALVRRRFGRSSARTCTRSSRVAPLALDLANFYRGLGITLLQGCALSQATGPTPVETPQDFPPDSVGFPWPGNQMMIAPDGELSCAASPCRRDTIACRGHG